MHNRDWKPLETARQALSEYKKLHYEKRKSPRFLDEAKPFFESLRHENFFKNREVLKYDG
jgi:hypothetical protein